MHLTAPNDIESCNNCGDGLSEALDNVKRLESVSESAPAETSTEDTEPALVNPRRTVSYLFSLPTAEALLDDGSDKNVAGVATEVVPVAAGQDLVHESAIESARGVRASLISISIHLNEGDSLGIRLKLVDGELIISYVAWDSPLNACLRVRDMLLNLDNNVCNKWTPRAAAQYITEKQGRLSVMVRNKNGDPDVAQAVVLKTHSKSKVGISFDSSGGRLKVKSIFSHNDIGNNSILSPGDYVKSINDIPTADLDSATAIDLVRGAPKYVSITVNKSNETELSVRDMTARYSDTSTASNTIMSISQTLVASEVDIDSLEAGLSTRPGLVSLKVSRPSDDVQFGISFKNEDGELKISKIRQIGLLGNSSILRTGMIIVSVNNIYCRKWDSKQALHYFRGIIGDLLIIAQDPLGDPLVVAAVASKPSPRSLAGVRFRASPAGIDFTNIDVGGIFADSVLNAGDTVLAINNVLCRHMTTSQAANFVKNEPSSIMIHAKSKTSTGIILSKYGANENANSSSALANAVPAAAESATGQQQQMQTGHKRDASFSIFIVVAAAVVIIIISATSQDDDTPN